MSKKVAGQTQTWSELSLRFVFKLLLTAVVLSSLLISFILPSHWAFLGMCTLLSLRADLIPSLQEGVPTTLPQQLITQKLWKGIRGVWRKMRTWADRNRGFALTQFPPFPVVSFMLTHFCSVNLQVHCPCLVHWVTAGPKHNLASKTSFPETFHPNPGKNDTNLWLILYWWHISCTHWLINSSTLNHIVLLTSYLLWKWVSELLKHWSIYVLVLLFLWRWQMGDSYPLCSCLPAGRHPDSYLHLPELPFSQHWSFRHKQSATILPLLDHSALEGDVFSFAGKAVAKVSCMCICTSVFSPSTLWHQVQSYSVLLYTQTLSLCQAYKYRHTHSNTNRNFLFTIS